MNRTLKKLVFSEYKRLITLAIIFIICLILSALIYVLLGRGTILEVNYDNISQLSISAIIYRTLKRNLIYFIVSIIFTIIGYNKIIYIIFALVSIYYGLSVIQMIESMQLDKIYFLFTFSDYFIYFPLVFYFTYISCSISKYTRKSKKTETISHKFDIIMTGYIKFSLIYLLIVIIYSLGYSYFIIILSRLLVR